MSVSTRLGIAALVLAGCVGCAQPGASTGAADAARRDATEALESVDDLRAELTVQIDDLTTLTEKLQGDLSARDRRDAKVDDRLDRLARRLDRLARRLDRALARIARSLESSDAVASDVQTALAEARSVARDLAVLDQRLDYHLKNHGGG
jgi:chromosome segregation ATPase